MADKIVAFICTITTPDAAIDDSLYTISLSVLLPEMRHQKNGAPLRCSGEPIDMLIQTPIWKMVFKVL